MASKKDTFKKFVTPFGSASYACVTEARNKFESEEKEFRCNIIFENEEAVAPLAAALKAAADTHLKLAIADAADKKTANKLGKLEYNNPFKPEEDEDGEDTGRIVLKITRNEKTKAGNENRVDVFDSKRNPIGAGTLIGNGSIIRLAFTAYGYAATGLGHYGMSRMLDAVQVKELVEYTAGGPRTATEHGFDSVDGDVIGADSAAFDGDNDDAPADDGSDY